MPMHDWARVDDVFFHDFQLGWISRLCARLNNGVLPSSHFALSETLELRPPVGFHPLPEPDQPAARHPDCADFPEADLPDWQYPEARLPKQYACRAITIRHAEHHQPVAAIMWCTRQDKQTPYRLRSFIQLAVGAVTHRIHLLIIDPFPPTSRDPQGIHSAIWDELGGEPFALRVGKPLTVASYLADDAPTAYVESLAVGDVLPDMPLFLKSDWSVACPLEATYQDEWVAYPAVLKARLERSTKP